MIILTLIFILILQAIADGLFDRGKKKLSKLIECFYIAFFFVLIYLFVIWLGNYMNLRIDKQELSKLVSAVGVCYLLLRLCIFDPINNIAANRTVYHPGTTTYFYENLITLLYQKTWQYWIFRLFYLACAIILYLRIFV